MILVSLLFNVLRYLDAEVFYDLICYFASVRGAKGGERFDLRTALALGTRSVRSSRTFGFFLNILCNSRQLGGYWSGSFTCC